MKCNFKNIIFFFSFTILFGKLVESENSMDIFLKSNYAPKSIENIDLFNIKNDNFEYETFQAPYKSTSTTLNLLTREISLVESAHLLRRIHFGPTIEEIDYLSSLNINDAVEYILRDIPPPPPPGNWIDDPFPYNYGSYSPEQRDSLQAAYDLYSLELNVWWLDQMFNSSSSIIEQMTLFWHDHFATSIETVKYPPAMYHQNKILREYAIGNFKDLVTLMIFDPAMMVWLDNRENRVGAINENFARELLELFTMGEGQYTQQDVMEAARALTGYQTNGLETYFVSDRFDNGVKTFLGQTGNFNTYDIIDIIFEQPQTAYFICEKLYKWFVYENPNEEIVQNLAQIMIDNNYEIKPVLYALFSSEHFFDDNFKGSKFKDPINHSLGVIRQSYIDINQTLYFQNNAYTLHDILLYVQNLNGLLIFNPPDVSGWPGYRNWINTFTLPNRKIFTNYIFDGTFGTLGDPVSFAERIPNGLTDPNALMDYLYIYFYSIQPSELTKQNLMDELLGGVDPDTWGLLYYEGAIERFVGVIERMLRLSEYQLK